MSRSKSNLSSEVLINTFLSLLASEQATEVAETSLLLSSAAPSTLAKAGFAILNLNISSLRTGMGGRTVVELVVDPAFTSSNTSRSSTTSTTKVAGKGTKTSQKSERQKVRVEGELPGHAIRPGDIVRIGEMPKGSAKRKEISEMKKNAVEGVITRVGERAVWMAAGRGGPSGSPKDEDSESLDALTGAGRLWLVKLANDATYKRMNQTMNTLLKTPQNSYTALQQVLFGMSRPTVPSPSTVEAVLSKLEFNNESLNTSQRSAIAFALASDHLALIHGPPGTGKTATITELILQFVQQNLRVLVCGPSNISVDNIVERIALCSPSTKIVRLGHPARLLDNILEHSLEILTKTSEAGVIVDDIRKEIDEKIASVRKTKIGREKKTIWGEVRELRKEYRDRESRCVEGLVSGSGVVLATLHGAGGRQVHGKSPGFDVVVIDEAAQGLEPACWIPIVSGGIQVRKLVLAGDHLQLPPTVKSLDASNGKDDEKKRIQALTDALSKLAVDEDEVEKAKEWSLEKTMFDRLLMMYGEGIKRLLNVQYRMNEQIMRFPSSELYSGKLEADASVVHRLLKDLDYGVKETDETKEALIFYDTQGGDFPEKTEDEEGEGKSFLLGDSKSNEMEAQIVKQHVEKLVAAGVRAEDIAVITPYNAQLAILRGLLKEQYPNLELGSVDGFQGREKEAVIVSLVRSNAEREVGFLGEKRRLNVAMTRPKRQLCVVGDSETVSSGSKFLKNWCKFLEDHADLRYPTLDEIVGV